MPEVVIRLQGTLIRNFGVLLLGLVWTCAGGLAPAAMELWTDYTSYKDYGIDWHHIGNMALAGMAPLAIAYWRKHKALLALPDDVQAILDSVQPIQRETLSEVAKEPQNPTQEKH